MRASFFSSIAHELRTPLNSIIPILRLVLNLLLLNNIAKEKLENYLRIILNSSIHLQNVIEDALDMSRLENNKFQIFKDLFDLRKVVYEVADLMKFQIEQKNLRFDIKISDSVPEKITTDVKRYK